RIAAHEPKHFCGGAQTGRLSLVFSTVPSRIISDRVDDHAPPAAISSRNLSWQTSQGHERVHKTGVRFAPEPGVHSAHRRAHNQPRMIDAEPVGQQSILRFHHVDVTVARKLRVQPIAWFTRFAVTNSVRKHDEKFCRIERLTFSEKLARKFRTNKLRAAASCPVHDEDSVARLALRVFVELADSSI